MSRKYKKIICPICKKEYTLRFFEKHLQKNIDHVEVYKEIKNIENSLESIKCLNCDEIINEKKHLIAISKYFDIPYPRRIYCSKKCRKGMIPWNKDKTKNDNEKIRKMSIERTGDKNPIKKVVADEEKRKKWVEKLKNKDYSYLKGRQFSSEHKEKLSILAKERYKNGWCPKKGKFLSQEVKDKIRINTLKNTKKYKTSNIQIELFNFLKENLSYKIELNYKYIYYVLDIAFPEQKICLEVDGDFWHCNEKLGYSPKFVCQKKNLQNDKRKNSFLNNKNWKVLRLWVSEIENNFQKVLEKVEELIRE